MTTLEIGLPEIERDSPQWYETFQSYRGQLRHWIASGTLPDPKGRVVWDMGCGWGAFALGFLAEGASRVVASDTFIDRSQVPSALFVLDAVRLIQGETADLATEVLGGHPDPPTLIFMHLVSEHVADLGALLRAIRPHCREETRLFIHHDNYYQPVGHHDHGFLRFHPETNTVESEAVACWDNPERCAGSEAHRARLSAERAWQWSDASEATRDPSNCRSCNYRIRATPWAHLIAADRFAKVWPEAFFRAALNKLTPFQLRQHVVESGFAILRESRDQLNNEVPAELEGQFTAGDLRTFTVTLVAAPDAPG